MTHKNLSGIRLAAKTESGGFMKVLELRLSYIKDARIKVIPHESDASDSVIPFNKGKQRVTILKALNSEDFHREDFSSEELAWMVKNELLTTDGLSFHSNMRENIGKILYRTLFPERSSTEKNLSNLIYDNSDLHIKIEVEGDVGLHRLFDYPWELLRDEQGFLAERGIYISRYIAFGGNSPPNLPPLKRINVLLVSSRASDPDNGLQFLSDEEHQAVRKGLEKSRVEEAEEAEIDEYIHIDILPQPVTFEKFTNYLQEHTAEETPHIIHFDGHGHFGSLCYSILPGNGECKTFNPGMREKCKYEKCSATLSHHQGYLLFEDDLGNPDYVGAQDFASSLGDANRSNETGHGIALVVLSACKSSLSLAENSVFNGVAQRLISQKIPAVVGMAFSVRVDSATAFTEQFYRAIRQKLPLVHAMSRGRQAMRFGGNQWYRPVLYLRWQDHEGGQIFAKQSESDMVARHVEGRQTIKQTGTSRRKRLRPVSPVTPKVAIRMKSSSTVLESAIAYYKKIKTKQIQLIPVYLLFGLDTVEDISPEHYKLIAHSPLLSIEDIFPEHCDLAILPLQDIAQPAQDFYDLVNDALKRERTSEMVQLQSSLMIPLRISCELLRKLLSLISDFKEVCQTSPSDMIEQRREIQTNLKALREKLNQINNTMDSYPE